MKKAKTTGVLKKTKKTKVAKVTKKKVAKKVVNTIVKKKYKSYYKPKKKIIESALIPPVNMTDLVEEDLDNDFVPIEVAPIVQKETIPSKRPVKYLNNRDLLAQVVLSKKQSKMTNDLAKMLQLLTLRYGKKGNFSGYTYNDDMQSYAMLMLVKTWDSFDPAKSSNPFAFFTQCIKNSFIQYLNYEKRQRDIRDEVLVDKGMNPSFGYTYDYEKEQANTESADNEVVEAPTKLFEDVDTFHAEPDNNEEDSTVPESF